MENMLYNHTESPDHVTQSNLKYDNHVENTHVKVSKTDDKIGKP